MIENKDEVREKINELIEKDDVSEIISTLQFLSEQVELLARALVNRNTR